MQRHHRTQRCKRRRSLHHPNAFTLAELLVVLAIITVLTALLLPAIESARATSRTVTCASTMRQIAQAMHIYASESRGMLPPNMSGPNGGTFWHSPHVLGKYIPLEIRDNPRGLTGRSVTCPDDEGASRSFSMNVWISSRVDNAIANSKLGRLWGKHVNDPARVLLLVETWSWSGSPINGFASSSIVGSFGAMPGSRFGGGGGIVQLFRGRFGYVNCEIDYSRHRKSRGPGIWTEPRGRANFAFADGHVELLRNDELVDYRTGLSTFEGIWSPLDHAQNAPLAAAAASAAP